MKKSAATLAALVSLAGCANITMSDGKQVVIEHEWPQTGESVLPMATDECKRAGLKKASLLRTTSKNPAFAWASKDVSTFRCE